MIIGINGPKGSGKNEVAKILERNYGFETVGFADKLKAICCRSFQN
jgi:dephospho-CoA kinase